MDELTCEEPSIKKAKKERRRSTLGRGRVSIGNPSDLNASSSEKDPVPEKTESAEAASGTQATCSNAAAAGEAGLESKVQLLTIYNDRLTEEQQAWQRLVDKYQQQAETAERLSATASDEPTVHKDSDCHCLSTMPVKYRQVIESRSDHYTDIPEFLQAVNSCNSIAAAEIQNSVSRLSHHRDKYRNKVQQELRQFYTQTSQDVGDWTSWFDGD